MFSFFIFWETLEYLDVGVYLHAQKPLKNHVFEYLESPWISLSNVCMNPEYDLYITQYLRWILSFKSSILLLVYPMYNMCGKIIVSIIIRKKVTEHCLRSHEQFGNIVIWWVKCHKVSFYKQRKMCNYMEAYFIWIKTTIYINLLAKPLLKWSFDYCHSLK